MTVYQVDASGNQVDITSEITFDVPAPKDLFAAQGGSYAEAELKPSYQGVVLENASVKVFVGVKGDTNLDGTCDITDAELTLRYYSEVYAGAENASFCELIGISSNQEEIEKLCYFLSDIDTEGKNAKNDASHEIDIQDAMWILSYYSYSMAGGAKPWNEICPVLTADSFFYR